MESFARMRALRQGIVWAIGAWLPAWELCTSLVPSLGGGPLFSRFAHDAALVASSLPCLWGALAGPP